MQKIFQNPSNLEQLAKSQYAIPPFLMMENAARALADFILSLKPEKVLILCGKGNNGGDGYALARLLQNRCQVCLLCLEAPAAEEAKVQYESCRLLGLNFTDSIEKASVIVDCIYGTGFHGQLPENVKKLLDTANRSSAIKVACDIPSGLYFQADYTITMGCQKLSLYSDKAKAVCGKIIVADLGIAREKFETESNIYLVEEKDCKIPLRKDRAAHKGKYGHTAVLCGDKAGAAILAATAAMNFGSGLTSLIKTEGSNLNQFKISPSLMLSDSIPPKTTCLALGSGFTNFPHNAAASLLNWFRENKASNPEKSPAAVLDAGILTSPDFPQFLKELNLIEGSRIILTPHLSELSRMLENCLSWASSLPPESEISNITEGLSGEQFSISSLAESPEARIEAGHFLTSLFPQTTIIMKSANTFISCGQETFIITDGAQSLAKGGSGDILAGLTAALLAQGYDAKTAAITAAEHHALLAQKLGPEAYNVTPEKLLELISGNPAF